MTDCISSRNGHAADRSQDLRVCLGVLMSRARRSRPAGCSQAPFRCYFVYWAGFASNLALQPFEQK